jgi:hypothetical protein
LLPEARPSAWQRGSPAAFLSQSFDASLYPAIGLFGTVLKNRIMELNMATGRKRQEQPKKPRSRKKPGPRLSQQEADDIALAEELLREAEAQHAEFAAGFEKFLKYLGIRRKPIGAKKLQDRMFQEGFDPQSNEFSRGVIEMREE